MYLSEVIMSKNKYVGGSKYKYVNIYNDWDDPSNSDYWVPLNIFRKLFYFLMYEIIYAK